MLELHHWTIFERPADYPQHFVVRLFRVVPGNIIATDDIRLADSLDEARRLVPPGLYCMPRSPGDEPPIVEVWM